MEGESFDFDKVQDKNKAAENGEESQSRKEREDRSRKCKCKHEARSHVGSLRREELDLVLVVVVEAHNSTP